MEALMWVSHAGRPLGAEELCHALAVELGSTDFNSQNIPSISTILSCCQGLITVDKKASTVRLIHFTLQEYLSAHPDFFSRPHSTMAETCLTYLNSEQVEALSADSSSDVLGTSFLEYCSAYWGVHAKWELSDDAMALALCLLEGYDGHISAKLLLEQVEDVYLSPFQTGFRFGGLHCASFFGINELVAALIQIQRFDINGGDLWGHTPLAWAAYNGHDEIVKILLEEEAVDANQPNSYGKTPLSHAAENGHGGVVEILLGRGEVKPAEPDIGA